MKRYIRSNTAPEVTVLYYWYDRGEIRNTPDEEIIFNAIRNHDFETFMKMRKKYPPDTSSKKFNGTPDTFTYFPDTAAVYEGDDLVGYIDITKRENFNKIDDTDFEWG